MAACAASTATIDWELLEAAISGDTRSMKMKYMDSHDPTILLGKNPQGNTCLHISSMCGHLEFCKDVLSLPQDPTVKKKLLTTVNVMNETPLLTAITSGHVTLAAFLLKYCHEQGFSEVILKQDKHKCNALHHAIRNGHKDLALELIATQPALSKDVNKYGESPMYIALMMRDSKFTDIFEKLLGIDGSSHSGTYGYNALHAAIRNGNPGENYGVQLRSHGKLA